MQEILLKSSFLNKIGLLQLLIQYLYSLLQYLNDRNEFILTFDGVKFEIRLVLIFKN